MKEDDLPFMCGEPGCGMVCIHIYCKTTGCCSQLCQKKVSLNLDNE